MSDPVQAPPRRRIAGKLVRDVVLIFATVVGSLTLMFVRAAQERTTLERERRAAVVTGSLAREIARALREFDIREVDHALGEAKKFDAELLKIDVCDAGLSVLAATDPASLLAPADPLLSRAVRAGSRVERRTAERVDVAFPILDRGTVEGALLVSYSLHAVRRDLRALYSAGGAALLLAVASGALLSLAVARRIAAPILELHRGARAITAGDLAVRLPEGGDDETALIARGFNTVTGALIEKIRALEGSSAELERAHRDLDGRVQDLKSLKEAGKVFSTIFNLEELLRAIVENATLVMKSRRCSIVMRDEESGEYTVRVGKGIAGEEGIVENVRLRSGGLIATHVFATRQPLLVTDLPTDDRFDPAHDGSRYATASFIAAPVILGDRVLAVLSVTDRRDGAVYTPADLNLLCVYANHIAIAIENARIYRRLVDRERLDHELGVAREIQMSLLPDGYPALDGIVFAGASHPALEVGGDYFDFLPVTDRRVGIVIGDVSGKGVPAALLMVMIRSILRARVSERVAPAELVTELNAHLLTRGDDKMFVTLFYAEVDSAARTLRYVNAGHNETLLLRADGTTEVLSAGGLLMGLFDHATYEERSADLREGDLVVFYTDGITETPDAKDRLYETERLEAVARANAHLSPEGVRDAILEDVRAYAGEGPPHDDRTLIILKVGPRGAAEVPA